jgi:c(7)-type cytochrome triheme protein
MSLVRLIGALLLASLLAPAAQAFLRAAPGSAPAADPVTRHVQPESQVPAARRAIDTVRHHDLANPDYQRLQRIDEATRDLPYDANGFPDWMQALNRGLIKPRAGLSGKEKMEVLDLDIIMRNTKEMPFVRFPHRSHTEWLACSNCHPDLFPTKAGSSTIQMSNIFRGEYCGKCHDRVAFVTFFSCCRCHSQPQPGKAPLP